MSDEEPAANESLQAHLRWLEGLADAPEQLLDLSDEDLVRLRRAAGRVALPDRMARRKLSNCLLYTSPSPRDVEESRMPSSA